jgi:hypothetical protein
LSLSWRTWRIHHTPRWTSRSSAMRQNHPRLRADKTRDRNRWRPIAEYKNRRANTLRKIWASCPTRLDRELSLISGPGLGHGVELSRITRDALRVDTPASPTPTTFAWPSLSNPRTAAPIATDSIVWRIGLCLTRPSCGACGLRAWKLP